MRLNKIIILILLSSIALSQSKNTFNGFLDFNYISRISDGSIINLPYRLFSLRIDHENEDILIKSNLAKLRWRTRLVNIVGIKQYSTIPFILSSSSRTSCAFGELFMKRMLFNATHSEELRVATVD